MKYLISIMLITTLSLNAVHSQPLRYDDNNDWKIDEQPVEWQPAPIEVTAGDLSLKVWLLHRLVPSPENGYLISRSDWIEIRRMLDNLSDEIERVKISERSSCDKRLEEKDDFCQNLNKDLIKEIDIFKKDIKFKDEQVASLKKENLWTKILTGTAILGLGGFSIYQATK